jgi:hypothetical protein
MHKVFKQVPVRGFIMRFPISYPSSGASYFLSKVLQVMGLATIVAVPICFASPAHADDFYRSNRQSNHWNAFPVGRVIINFPSQQQTTESTRIIQIGGFGSRNDRFFGQQYNTGYSEHNRFGGDRYDNDRYNNDRYDNNRNVQVIRRYDDRYSDHGLSLQIQPKDRPFFSIGNQVGTTEIRRFPIVNRQRPYSSFPFQQINRW